MCLALSSCISNPPVVNVQQSCDIDQSLVKDLTDCERPVNGVQSGDIATCAKALRIQIHEDHPRKAELRKQIALCHKQRRAQP